MANPFATEEMAAGYAKARPPVHPRVIERAFRSLQRERPFRAALDIGCGAGVSTQALQGFAGLRIGIEPNEAMLRWASRLVPEAQFLAGAAEAIPLRDRSVDFIAAAGSLNYCDLERFYPEADRVLAPGGVLLVYDFSPGRTFESATGLDEWFVAFQQRYPAPANEAHEVELGNKEEFAIPIPMTPSRYVDYMLTETNVAAAVRRGGDLSEIRSWCAESLQAIWPDGERKVIFRGYYCCGGGGVGNVKPIGPRQK